MNSGLFSHNGSAPERCAWAALGAHTLIETTHSAHGLSMPECGSGIIKTYGGDSRGECAIAPGLRDDIDDAHTFDRR